MQEIIMAKLGEIVLKGLNRRRFEDALFKNIKHRLAPIGEFEYSYFQSTVYISSKERRGDFCESAADQAFAALSNVFGIASLTRAAACEKDFERIAKTAAEYLGQRLSAARTFKVESKRSDKLFAMKSPEICRELGGRLLEAFPHLSVDVNNPDLVVRVEIREKNAFVHAGSIHGAGGLPVGTSGSAALMLSGGIDSPVAGCMIAKRGCRIVGVHFHSYPYTSERAKQKVLELASLMSRWCGEIKVVVVSFTEIQEQMRKSVPEDLFTVVMRRFMMRITERIAQNEGCRAVVTGESLAQVASQTLGGLTCTDEVAAGLVMRPLIGLDKNEIIERARYFGTYDKSIEPYEDCCVIFSPKHPVTNPKIPAARAAEEGLDVGLLVARAVESAETYYAKPHSIEERS